MKEKDNDKIKKVGPNVERLCTNQAVQLQKMARDLKFWI